MNEIGRLLIVVGAVILLTGVVLLFFGKLGFGRLPGDFMFKRGNVRFYFPLMTSLILSFVLSLLFWILQRK
ncbi:MAG: DUF2905 domain-containing protein [Acidobacteriota bacterium]